MECSDCLCGSLEPPFLLAKLVNLTRKNREAIRPEVLFNHGLLFRVQMNQNNQSNVTLLIENNRNM